MKILKKAFFSVFAVLGLAMMLPTYAQQGGSPTYQGGFGDVTYTENVGVAGAGQEKGDSLIGVIKGAVNWLLGILSFITLLILLYGGFQMVTAAGDEEKYKAGFKILKQAAGGLAFIGLSYLVVRFIFWLIGTLSGGGNTVG